MTIDFVATVENDENMNELINGEEVKEKIESMLTVLNQ